MTGQRRGVGFEGLEDRRLLAVAWADGELLVQFAPDASAEARTAARALLEGECIETIQTESMKDQNWGAIERVRLGKGRTVEQAAR
jgi:hypothetical protein